MPEKSMKRTQELTDLGICLKALFLPFVVKYLHVLFFYITIKKKKDVYTATPLGISNEYILCPKKSLQI